MNTSSSNKWWLYAGTLVIELITGVFRLLFTIPLVMLILIIVEFLLGKMGIQLFDAYRSYTDLQYSQRLLWFIFIAAAMLAYANIIASLFAAAGFGGGSLMTRFVLGAREPSTRERETILAVFEQMAEGVEEPIQSYSKLYVIDAVLEFADLVGTTLYVSSAAFRGSNLQALVAHEFGHLNNGDGSLILALRRLVFPPFSLFIGGIRDFSTNRPAYQPGVKEFDAIQIFYSMINNIIFFTLAFIGGGLGVWAMSWAWASYFRARDYVADSFAAGLGYRDLLLRYLEANIYFDTSVPYMLGWRPAAELRIDALSHPELYGLPTYDDVPAAADADFAPLAEVEPAGERSAPVAETGSRGLPSSQTARNLFTVAIIVLFGYALIKTWPGIQAQIGEMVEGLGSVSIIPDAGASSEGAGVDEPSVSDPAPAATAVAGLAECPLLGQTGSDEGVNWAVSVPEDEIAFINAQEFDALEGGVFVTVAGPYEGEHWVKGAAYCGGIPEEADYAWLKQQRLNLLSAGYQELMLADTSLASSCPYSQEWFEGIQETTTDIPGLLGALDHEFNRVGSTPCSGAWTGPGFTIPEKSIFWTNLYEDRFNSSTLTPIRADGGWGVFYTSEPFAITSGNNSGGRYILLNDELTNAGNLSPQNPVKSRAEMLVDYNSIYNQQGWCSLWDRLIDDGLVKGSCPANVLQFVYEDVPTSNGSVNLLTGLQMSASNDTDIYYQACATFDNNADYTGGSVESWINSDFIGTNTTLHAGSVFTMYFRCDNAWSPSPPVEEATLDSLLEADVLAQIEKLGYNTTADFAEAWGLRIGLDKTNGEVDPSEILTCPGETNGCVRITREKNANGAVEWAFYARNPNDCQHDGYRREPGEGGQTGVPPNFEGLLEGVTIRRCQETNTSEALPEEPAASNGQGCVGTQLGPLVQADHTFQAPVIVLQLWRMNGNSPWGDGEVMAVVENEVTIRGAGGNAWSYPAANCLNVATIEMQGGANLRGSAVVTPEDLRAAGMID